MNAYTNMTHERKLPDRSVSTIDNHPTEAEVKWLDEQLVSFNKQHAGRYDFKPLNLVVRDDSGSIVAGLKAVTGWDWLYVEVLWVHERHRRNGLGTQLLERAEREAAERSCIGSCLTSFSFQAPEFYERLGYSAFGQIDDYPLGSTMFFMSKRF